MVSVFIRAFPFKSTTHRSIVNKDHVYSHTKQHTQPLCEHTQPLYTLMESNFQGPMFIRGSPYKIIHITTVWTLENNFQGTMFIRVPPIKQLPSVEFVMFNSTFIYSVLVYYSVLHLRYNTLNRSNTNKSTKRPQRIDQLKKKINPTSPKRRRRFQML